MRQPRFVAVLPRAAATAALVLALLPGPGRAQRLGERIGHYVPPRAWPIPPHAFDLLHQRIAVRFDMAYGSVAGEVTTRVAITHEATDTVRLSAVHLSIDEATRDGRRLRFTADSDHVTVRLPRRAAVGDTVEFTLRYRATPERGLHFVPRRNVVWSAGEAIDNPAWIPTSDAPDDKDTWELLVTADTGLKVLSNGSLQGVSPAPRGAQVWDWVQAQPASPYLMSVVVGPFTVLHDQWRGVPVNYWVYPDTTAAAWRTFGETPGMIELYSRLLGPYPWPKYDQAAVPDPAYGGLENVSATTQTDLALHGAGDEPEQSGRWLTAHELAHQWFGDLVTTADWADAWLNEGMATYMESVHAEETRGRDAAEMDWIQQQEQAEAADLRQPRPVVWGTYSGSDPMPLFFSGHIYTKGAQVAHQLRRLLGDSLFWAGLRRYLIDNAYKAATTPDLADAFEQTCNCDLGWFFDQWAYGIGYPKVRWSRQWSPAQKVLALTVDQTQRVDSLHPLFRFPVTVRVITRDSVVRQQIMVSKLGETFYIALPGAPLSVRFDEGGWLLGKVTSDMTPLELADMATHDLDFSARYWALDQLAQSTDTAAVGAYRFIVLNEHDAALRQMAVGRMRGDTAAAGVAVVRSALRDPDSGVRAQALQTLVELDSVAARPAAEAMAAGDPNNAVRAAALRVLTRLGDAAALPLDLAYVREGNPLGLRLAAGDGLVRFRTPEAVAALRGLTAPSEVRNVRVAALRQMLAQGDTTEVVALATRYASDPDALFAMEAIRVLARLGGAPAHALLLRRFGEESRAVVKAAIGQALQS